MVFGLLVLATFTAFFAAQRLKRVDPLVYAVQMKKFISPNADGLRERGYVRFRTKRRDVFTVEVLDRARRVVRTLADGRTLEPGAHRFYWNGRSRPRGRLPGRPVADGAYRVRISLARAGRTFVPDKFFVVDTSPPRLSAAVSGAHTVSVLRDGPPRVKVEYRGVSPAHRAVFEVYAVRDGRAGPRPVAAFASESGRTTGTWDLTVGAFERRVTPDGRVTPCFGRLEQRGRARPAGPGAYVFVARACDAAGNPGSSAERLPPVRGAAGARAGVTLRGIELSPGMLPLRPGSPATFVVNPPPGGYRYRLRAVGGRTVASGRERGATLRLRPPRSGTGLYTLRVTAIRKHAAWGDSATVPVVLGSRRERGALVVYPAIAWQGLNPVDDSGDGFPDDFAGAPGARPQRVPAFRTLAGGRLPRGFAGQEGALARFLARRQASRAAEATTDYALAADPEAALAGRRAVLFAGDERWITPELGLALNRFVRAGGRVAFFAPDALRRTVRIAAGSISGPSDRSERDVFGESLSVERSAPAPLVAFADQLGLLRGPTGLFSRFESSRSRARAAELLVSAGRRPGSPVLVAYRLGRGLVIRVGVTGWQAAAAGSASRGPDPNVAYTTERMLEELIK